MFVTSVRLDEQDTLGARGITLALQYAPARSAREPGKAHNAPTRQSFEELNKPAKVTGLGHIGCYFRDPENNPTEVFWLTCYTSWAQVGIPIDIDQSDAALMADVLRFYEAVKDVHMGQPAGPETVDAIRDLSAAAVAAR